MKGFFLDRRSFRELIACYDTVVTRGCRLPLLCPSRHLSPRSAPAARHGLLLGAGFQYSRGCSETTLPRKRLCGSTIFLHHIQLSTKESKRNSNDIPKLYFFSYTPMRKRATGWFQLTKKHYRATSINLFRLFIYK